MAATCPRTATNHHKIVSALLPLSRQSSGGSPHSSRRRQSPLRESANCRQANQRLLQACQRGDFAAVREFIDQGADLEATVSIRGEIKTPLLLAVGVAQIKATADHHQSCVMIVV